MRCFHNIFYFCQIDVCGYKHSPYSMPHQIKMMRFFSTHLELPREKSLPIQRVQHLQLSTLLRNIRKFSYLLNFINTKEPLNQSGPNRLSIKMVDSRRTPRALPSGRGSHVIAGYCEDPQRRSGIFWRQDLATARYRYTGSTSRTPKPASSTTF
jgi:hypothetical protein